MALSTEITYAPKAWKLLNGVFCVYKPSLMGNQYVRSAIAERLVTDLNDMEVRPPQLKVAIEGNFREGNLCVLTKPSYADHPLVVGPRYQKQDMRLSWVNYIGWDVSGVMVGGVGSRGCALARRLKAANFLRVYQLKGKFGKATDNFMDNGRVVEKATLKHVTREKLDLVISKIELSQQRQMFKSAGVDMQSQAGYELAAGGVFRPGSTKTTTIVYGLKCIQFSLPEFTVEMHTINENPLHLKRLVHEIGIAMRSAACVSQIRCTRYGNFTLEHSLLQKHWDVENFINNIQLCKPLTVEEKIEPVSPHLMRPEKASQESFLEMLKRDKEIMKVKGHPVKL